LSPSPTDATRASNDTGASTATRSRTGVTAAAIVAAPVGEEPNEFAGVANSTKLANAVAHVSVKRRSVTLVIVAASRSLNGKTPRSRRGRVNM
jgi:hypothetical protein